MELGYERQMGKFERVVRECWCDAETLESLNLLVTTGVDSGERMVVRWLEEVSS